MRIYTIWVLVGLLSFSTPSFSQEIVLQGKLGSHPILMVLYISDADDSVIGQYAYNNKLISIHLEGKSLNHLTEFKLPPRIDDWGKAENYTLEPHAIFKGEFHDNHYKGVWKRVNNQVDLAFDLTEVEDKRANTNNSDFFNTLIAKQIRFTPLGEEIYHANGLITQQYEEAITKTINSRFVDLGNEGAQKNINQLLENKHKEAVMDSIWCLSDGYSDAKSAVGHTMDYPDFEINHYHPPLLEISYSASIYCGGAHPSNFYNITVIDTSIGHTIDLKSLFNLYQDDDEILSNAFKSILLRHIDQDKTNECIYEDVESPDLYSLDFHLARKENHIGVKYIGLGHAMFVCELEDIATIPVIELKSLALPEAANYFSILK